MIAYLLSFVLSTWPNLAEHRIYEVSSILADIEGTDATPIEALELANIAAFESGFSRRAHGRAGERGAFQIMPPATAYGAAEALRRLRAQGMVGYVGCAGHADAPQCQALIAHRTDPALLWRLAFDPPDVATETASR
jgi:hypothetical protein